MARKTINKYVDIDDILAQEEPYNRVARVGVELEGAWKEVPSNVNLEVDNSVCRGNRQVVLLTYPYIGELPIGPMVVASIPKQIRKYYPHYVDHTCGMHIHMSFETLRYYNWLMVPEYQETIIEYLTRWAKEQGFSDKHYIYNRLSGQNVFCQKKFWPDEQAQHKEKDHDQARHGHRYTIVHYCGRNRTVEVRVLPMMNTPAQAILAINKVIDITNACLIKLANKNPKFKGSLELPEGGTYEEFVETQIPLTISQRRRIGG